jgi:site-specific DNA-cytosine methylase
MNVLSLFDGIGVAYLALKRAGIKVDNYFASEIDLNASRVALSNHPDIIQLGDVKAVKGSALSRIDLLIGGSPCTNLSSMGKQEGLSGEQSKLFYEYVRLLKELKPKYFLLENVASMRTEERDKISALVGVEPILINSSLVSAQCRKRLYWTNIPGVGLPSDKKIMFQDIVSGGFVDREKSHALLTNQLPQTEVGLNRYLFKCTGQIVFKEKYFAELDKGTKAERFCNMQKLRLLNKEKNKSFKNGVFRNITIHEAEALQTLPKDYTAGIALSNRFRALGNSFTCDVIAYILSKLPSETL